MTKLGLTPSGLRKEIKGILVKKERKKNTSQGGREEAKNRKARVRVFKNEQGKDAEENEGKGKWEWKRRGRDGRGKESEADRDRNENAAAMRPETEKTKNN